MIYDLKNEQMPHLSRTTQRGGGPEPRGAGREAGEDEPPGGARHPAAVKSRGTNFLGECTVCEELIVPVFDRLFLSARLANRDAKQDIVSDGITMSPCGKNIASSFRQLLQITI